MAPRSACNRGSLVALVIGWVTKNFYLELLRALEGKLSRFSRLHLQFSAPTNLHWARVVGYGQFSLCVIHKEGLYASSGDINRLMMKVEIINRLVWCPGQKKRIASLPFLHGCCKRRLKD
jgi:hypothetical protein